MCSYLHNSNLTKILSLKISTDKGAQTIFLKIKVKTFYLKFVSKNALDKHKIYFAF